MVVKFTLCTLLIVGPCKSSKPCSLGALTPPRCAPRQSILGVAVALRATATPKMLYMTSLHRVPLQKRENGLGKDEPVQRFYDVRKQAL